MTWLRKVDLCQKCAPGPRKGHSVEFSKCIHCGRVGCEDLVNGYKNECVPSADEESCLEYVDKEGKPSCPR